MKNSYTHITHVLDRSGSMGVIATDIIGGFNKFLAEQQAAPGECSMTLVQFDDVIETVYENRAVKDTPKLDSHNYVPRNCTALFDAVGKAINSTGKFLKDKSDSERPARVIFLITTDGLENASSEFDRAEIFKMISHQRDVYKWDFLFIGANQDAFAAGEGMGIAGSKIMNMAANTAGVQAMYCSSASNIRKARSYSAWGMSAEAAIATDWTDEDRKAQDEAK